jgi:hypothetical protein
MLGRYRHSKPWIASWFVLALLPACMEMSEPPAGTPVEGHAFLTVVGTTSVTVDGTSRDTLTVSYHDDLDQPLVGPINFYLIGDPRGADLSAVTATTDAQGLAHIDVLPGVQTTFQVTATASYAKPVSWNVTIGPGGSVLDATGIFQLASEFDVAASVPESIGAMTAQLREMVDGANDPGSWVLDQMLAQSGDVTFNSAVTQLRPNLDELVNYQLVRNTPGLLDLLTRLADNLDGVTHKFGAVSTVTVAQAADGGLVATHDVSAYRCVVEGQPHEYTLAKLSVASSHADGVLVMVRGKTRVTLVKHQLAFAYGHFLRYVLDHVVVPALLGGATNVGQLLSSVINCNRLAQVIASRIGGVNLSYENACLSALTSFGDRFEQQLDDTAAQAGIEIVGNATPVDVDGDGRIDRLDAGKWEGALGFPIGATTLAPDQTFTATRL